jgi:hypothetical protein
MRRQTFRLMTVVSFCLLVFSLYLNFLYKGGNSEFAPVKRSAAIDSTNTAQMERTTNDVLVQH